MLIFLVAKLGYDRRALKGWSVLAFVLCVIAFFLLPPAGAELSDPNLPRNVNYVFGFDDAKPQEWMPANVYLVAWMALLLGAVYAPTHLLMTKLFTRSNHE